MTRNPSGSSSGSTGDVSEKPIGHGPVASARDGSPVVEVEGSDPYKEWLIEQVDVHCGTSPDGAACRQAKLNLAAYCGAMEETNQSFPRQPAMDAAWEAGQLLAALVTAGGAIEGGAVRKSGGDQ